MTDPHAAYSQQAATTAGPAQLVLMLYDGALARIEAAREELAVASPDMAAANEDLKRAQAIVRELQITLDMDQGGEIAQRLSSIYDYCYRLLLEANLEKAAAPLDEVLTTLTPIRDAWEQSCVHQPAVAG